MRKADNLSPSCAVFTKSGNLNFLVPSGPLRVCNGPDLPFYQWRNTTNVTAFFFLVNKYWEDKLTYGRTKYEHISLLNEACRHRKYEIKCKSTSETKFQTSDKNKPASSALAKRTTIIPRNIQQFNLIVIKR